MRSTIRALALAAALFTAGAVSEPSPAAAADDYLNCVGVCLSASVGCGLIVPSKADVCLIFLQGCFDGCNLA